MVNSAGCSFLGDFFMTANWFYAIDGERRGPTDWIEVEQLLASGRLNEQSLVWRKGMEQWQPISEVAPPPLPPPTPTPPVRLSQNKSTSEPRPRKRHVQRPAAVSLSQRQLAGILVGVMLTTAALSGALVVLATRFNDAPNQQKDVRVATPEPAPTPPISLPQKESEPVTDTVAAAEPPFAPPPNDPPIKVVESAFPASEADATPVEPMIVDVAARKPPGGEEVDPNPPVEQPAAQREPEQPPAAEPAQPAFAWLESELFQETNVRRKTQFTMIGAPTVTSQEYQILSVLNVGKAAADGSFSVSQTILDTKLHGADELSRPVMAADLKRIIGSQFGYRVHPAHGILDFANADAEAKGAAVKNDTVEGMFTGAAMDDDGWRELAHLTFLQPPEPLKQGVQWRRQILHDWKSLGVWSGDTEFAFDGRRKDSDWIKYAHDLTWKPPAADAKGSMLNFTSARFEKASATGMVQYDPDEKRVLAAEESFAVKGVMQAELAGQKIPIEMSEMQSHGIRVLDQNPWRQ